MLSFISSSWDKSPVTPKDSAQHPPWSVLVKEQTPVWPVILHILSFRSQLVVEMSAQVWTHSDFSLKYFLWTGFISKWNEPQHSSQKISVQKSHLRSRHLPHNRTFSCGRPLTSAVSCWKAAVYLVETLLGNPPHSSWRLFESPGPELAKEADHGRFWLWFRVSTTDPPSDHIKRGINVYEHNGTQC